MGLTLVKRGDGPPKKDPKVALVLAGGAVSGGAFKVGGLKALDDFLVGRGVTDFDVYVGLSAGSLLAVPLAAGVGPEEMMGALDGTSGRFEQLRPIDFYGPNWQEWFERPASLVADWVTYLPDVARDLARSLPNLPNALAPALLNFIRETNYRHFEELAIRLGEHVSPERRLPSLTDHIPSGFFDNALLERWLRKNLERIGMPNDFRTFTRKRNRSLYLSACNLDSAERVIFGADENCSVTISQAMQASTALPGFYRPARINGVDYVDGGVRNTANIDVAIDKGADLIICYNPFRPLSNSQDFDSGDRSGYGSHLADRGLKAVMNQVFRTMLHSRLKLGMQRYLTDDRFRGDIVLLEPQETDAEFFAMNPIAFWNRAEAMRHGFESVHETLHKNFGELSGVFGRYGLKMSRSAARQKAEKLRAERWSGGEDTQSDPSLRLVGS